MPAKQARKPFLSPKLRRWKKERCCILLLYSYAYWITQITIMKEKDKNVSLVYAQKQAITRN